MGKIIKIEMKRAFWNIRFWGSILVGMLIAGSQIITWVLPSVGNLDNYLLGKGEYPVSLFNTWMGASGHTFQLTLFFIILPILSCIPYADSSFVEKDCGYRMHMLMKMKKSDYYTAKITATYLSGGVAVIIPLFVNLFITAMLIPAVIPEASAGTFPIFEHSMWCNLYYTQPFYYLGGYFIIIFLYSGLFALYGMAASLFVKNRFIVVLVPFIIYTVANFLLGYTGNYKFSPELFLRPDQPAGADFFYICMFYLLGMMIAVLTIFYKERKSDLYV